MKKSLWHLLLLGLLMVSLSACGGGGGDDDANPTQTPNPTYTVTYDGNNNTSGSVPADTSGYEAGATVTVLGNTGSLVKTGYSFAGWNTLAAGTGTTYAQAQTFTMGSANITLYANWTSNPTYTVTYDGNGNTGGSIPIDSTNYEGGQTVTVLGNTGNLVKTGYTFTGWNTLAAGTGTTYTQSQTFARAGGPNVTLYAKWTANSTYTVTYDGNGNTGGSVPIDSTNYEGGQTVTALGNTGNLVKTGYAFVGWNTQADGTGTTYVQGQTFSMGSANITLYANWTSNPTYTVTYDGNNNTGGSVPIDSTRYEEGQAVTVLGNTGNLEKVGYAFDGWNTQADGTGMTYVQGQTPMMGSANLTMYAKWTSNPTYTVTYDGNGSVGGSVPTESNYEQGQAVTVPGNTGNLMKSGYTFAGWNTQANGTGTTYVQGQTFSMGSANVTLYAKWTSNPTYTVTYNGSNNTGGSVPIDSTNYEQGQTITVFENPGNLVKTGYWFTGWNTQSNGLGTTYTGGYLLTVGSANLTLYAKWTANPIYSVTYSGNGQTSGSAPIDSNLYEQGTNIIVRGNTGSLVKAGHSFSGWNTQADGAGTTYGASFAMAQANVTLYAKWIATTFTDNLNHTMTDNRTGLMWIKAPEGASNWQNSMGYCDGLVFAGHADWRLPSINEFNGLFQGWTGTTLGAWLNSQGFVVEPSTIYWTSSTNTDDTNNAWALILYTGDTFLQPRSYADYIWAVRTGP